MGLLPDSTRYLLRESLACHRTVAPVEDLLLFFVGPLVRGLRGSFDRFCRRDQVMFAFQETWAKAKGAGGGEFTWATAGGGREKD